MSRNRPKNQNLSVGVGAFRRKFKGDMTRLKKAVMIKLFSAVIKDTPVLTGRLRGNWSLTFKEPLRERRVGFQDPTQRVTSQIEANVTQEDGSAFLTNNMPYAGRIEYDGHSKTKAPQGMVRRNLVRIASNLKKEAARIAEA
jgi:hypothetical protein